MHQDELGVELKKVHELHEAKEEADTRGGRVGRGSNDLGDDGLQMEVAGHRAQVPTLTGPAQRLLQPTPGCY